MRSALAIAGVVASAVLLGVMVVAAEPFQPDGYGPGQDARAYWAASLERPYVPGSVGHESAYLYSPAFLQLVAPLQLLPWPVFVALWTAALLLVLRWLSGPVLLAPLIALTLPELWGGNITILLAAAIVVGFRWPQAWALAFLTKVTPGVGVLWFVIRREWRSLAIALAATAVVAIASAVIASQPWRDWTALLTSSVEASTVPGSLPIPLLVRLPFAVLVIAVAALRDQRWLLPIGVLLAFPVLWWGSFSILVASVALRRDEIERWLIERVVRLRPPVSAEAPA